MAIKISGSTIIDDSRNIVNAGVVTATSFCWVIWNCKLNWHFLTGTVYCFCNHFFWIYQGSPAILVSSAGINTDSAPTNLYVSGSSAGNVVGLGTTDANTTLNFATGNNFSVTLDWKYCIKQSNRSHRRAKWCYLYSTRWFW
jgi:hypothetical protein